MMAIDRDLASQAMIQLGGPCPESTRFYLNLRCAQLLNLLLRMKILVELWALTVRHKLDKS